MSVPAPHFLLRSRASRAGDLGRWSFELKSADGADLVNIEEIEPETNGERLELLALVRGLEALPAPARVTLRPASTHVQRVLNSGLDEWRDSDWQWECHGQMVPVKNADLWRRIDHALQFHQVNRCSVRADAPQEISSPNAAHRSPIRSSTRMATQRCKRICDSQLTPSCPARGFPRAPNRRSTWARKVFFVALTLRRRMTQRWADCRAVIDSLAAECATQP